MPAQINPNDQTILQYNIQTGGANNRFNNVAPGTSGQVYTSNGVSAQPTFQSLPAMPFTSMNVQVFTSSGTYTPTSGMIYCIVEVVGGGGGGGNAGGLAYSTGAGGGAGGYARQVFSASAIGASQAITIGAGGAAAGSGTSSSFGSLITCTGGGPGHSNGTTGAPWNGGVGGTVTIGGTFNVVGGYGYISLAANASGVYPGSGGKSFFASGGAGGGVGSITGSAGSFGSGGGGGGPGSSASGGAGGAGIIVVTEFV